MHTGDDVIPDRVNAARTRMIAALASEHLLPHDRSGLSGGDMTYFIQNAQVAEQLSRELVAAGFSPFVATRSDALSRLSEALDMTAGVLTVPRDDNAIAIAAGVSLAGGHPAVLLRNSGPGSAAEAIGSVLAPHEVAMLLVVAIGGPADPASDELAMVRISEQVLDEFGIESVPLDPTRPAAEPVAVVRDIVRDQFRPAALLVPTTEFGRAA
jgi:sulfopyruvate decarboxylase TPP-binding subunit